MNNIKSAKDTKKILILGVTGMLGNAIFRVLSENFDDRFFEVTGNLPKGFLIRLRSKGYYA